MTEEEVQEIYDYLHENYRYEDGDLIRKSVSPKNKKVKVGDKLGSFFYQSDQQPRIRCTLYVNKKNHTKNLSHFIYLYCTKQWPKVIDYLDANPTNCRIENLKSCSRVEVESKKEVRGWKPYISSTGKTRYRITLQIGAVQKIHFGSCETAKEAREVYDLAKKIHVEERLPADEIKKKVMTAFPHLKMKLKIENECGYPGVFKRGDRFVARHRINDKIHTATFDSAKEAYDCYLIMKNGNFKRTTRIKNSDYCSIEGCNNKYHANGMCSRHYSQMIRRNFPRKIRGNKTGFAGVKFDKGRYSSRYNNKHLGMYNTPEEAHAAYLKAKEEYAQRA